ncbi:MAG: M14 family zinc carboxypeptidase, partial [Bacteroidales bacterium]|nr:M14 family zinc carboxypeptidase [Bacteroidales bacterium]
MRYLILLLLSLLLSFQIANSQDKKEYVIKFDISNHKELVKITKMVSIDNVEGNVVYAYVNNKQLEKFKQSKYSFTILPTPSEKSAKVAMATTVDAMSNWDKYPTHGVYTEMMRQFGINHPNICKIDTIGFTTEGREVLVAKISDNVAIQEDEPEVFYTGQMHGDEIVDYIMYLRLIDYLLNNYDSNAQAQDIINNIELWINPLSNPDGTYAGGNTTVNSATRTNANSVDLNRNYPDPDDGPHSDGNSYQLETQMMMNFADAHNFTLSSNSHSGAEVMNYPWDTWSRRHVDDTWFQYASLVYADLAIANSPTEYFTGTSSTGIINGYDWYVISGGRQDYMNYYKNCREITLELSLAKMLSDTELPNHWDYNKDAMLTFLEESLYGFRGTVKNSVDDALYAKIEINEHDADIDSSMVFTDADVGDYHRMIQAGTYSITASAYGYIPQTIDNVSIANGHTSIKDFVLTQASTTNITGIITDGDTGNPLENVKIELLNTPIEAVYTNSSGEYSINNVMENDYTIRVSLSNYAASLQDISVTESNNVFNFDLFTADIEDFETNNFSSFNWQHSGNQNWTTTSTEKYEGTYSVVSGDITDNQSSTLELELQIEQSGEISFYKKVSSESAFDYLKFYIDNEIKGSWSGNVNWSLETFFVSNGTHTFKWEYSKDLAVSDGSDCAWIDYISFPKILKIPAKLSFTPDTIDLKMDVNATSEETINITNIGSTTLNYTISVENAASNPWISLNATNGSLNYNDSDNIIATINTDASENTYNCNIIISHNGTKSDTIIPVIVVASFHPELSISQNEIIETLLEDSIATTNIELSNSGTGTINYTIEVENKATKLWISLDNSSGILNNDTESIGITLDATGLPAQQYSCNIIITDEWQNEYSVPVRLTVSSSVGFNNNINNSIKIKTYPNPFSEKLNITIDLEKPLGISVGIYNINGQKIKYFNYTDKKENNYQLSWGTKTKDRIHVPKGIYFIKITT